MVSTPVVQEAPTEIVAPELPVAASEPEPARPAREPAAPRAVAAVEPAPAVPAAAPAVASPAPATDAAIAPIEPVTTAEVPAAAAPDAADPAGEPSYGILAGVLAALGIAGLAAWGFVAIGRRRKFAEAAAPVVERPVVTEPRPQSSPAALPASSVTPLASPRPVARAAESGLAHAGASVALPREMPATFAERDALLRRMIEARPDRANPFRSPKARARRARLILQSLGRDFGNAEPRIDLSQYASNWPSVARRKSAAA